MKVLFNCNTPFSLAHGGAQIQLEQTKSALEQIGVAADYFRWWDANQTGDVLHQLGTIPLSTVHAAQSKGLKVVQTLLLSLTCNRSSWQLLLRQVCARTALAAPLPYSLKTQLPWMSARACDLVIVGLEAERMVLERIYGIPRQRIAVVPLGLAEAFLKAEPPLRCEPHLICTGTIAPVKNSLELARLAGAARVPILFVGKPYDFSSNYWKDFSKLVDGRFVMHRHHVESQELIGLLRQARGYVLMSRWENWSLTAHEAAACGLPLLLPNLRWARERFGNQAVYFPSGHGMSAIAQLREFYERCPHLNAPKVQLHSWVDVANQLHEIYASLLGSGEMSQSRSPQLSTECAR